MAKGREFLIPCSLVEIAINDPQLTCISNAHPGKKLMVRHVLLPAVCRASRSKGQQSSFLSCHTSSVEGLAVEAVTCCATNSCLPGHA